MFSDNKKDQQVMKQDRKSFLRNMGTALFSGGMLSMAGGGLFNGAKAASSEAPSIITKGATKASRVALDPTDIPPPINRRSAKTHEITLTCKEIVSEIEPGVRFKYMTFGGTVPGPMIRVRQGDTVKFTLENPAEHNDEIHNIDFHSVYGTGGGAEATMCPPGVSKTIEFKAMYPGSFIYHCAVPKVDQHISSGMFGMIVVEPPEGLPEVDHEFYFGQHEVYSKLETGEKGDHAFDFEKMKDEIPTYVLLNGEKKAITPDKYGALKVKRGETARVFLVTGGPNITSNFHPIGNVWTKSWREGAFTNRPEEYLQTCQVAPGSCGVFEMEFPVPEDIYLVDHALSRYANKGMLGVIRVEGEEQPHLFNPNA